ncbi:hypothetical protein [Oceanidesulfovibrio marinus]|uniref:N-acetyltransferase domain-containing protein n=1 Tax=Oceanidesulfovibrio marinus TaxID=370038 RepID=A0A6P1ZBA1_9BACT|nr:hypothetical protein [Oceanidesulfovibrio marinus]TVM30260.1 hypothetical protein DQK91_21395 [Oceanidesulfovibrio marinus]
MITVEHHCRIVPKAMMNDPALAGFWDRLAESRTVNAVFYGGDCTSREHFVAFVRRPDVLFFGLLWDGEPGGFLILDRIEGRWARIHFGMFKGFYGHKARTMARFGVAHLLFWQMDGTYVFDGFMGITPENNKLAQRFIQKVGARVYCTIPEIGVISHTSRDTVNESWMEA